MASVHATSKETAEDGIQVALITAPPSKAKEVARSIVGAKLAACVNIVPGITSVYHWKGAVEEDSESLLIAKTRSSLADRLIAHVREVHPYDVPEVIFTDVRGGLQEYLDWVRSSTLPVDPQAAPHGGGADRIGSGEKGDGASGGDRS